MTRNLNATVNRTIGMAPRDVTFDNVPAVSAKLYQDRNTKPCKFSEGNKVRIPRDKNIFSKGYAQSKFRYHNLTILNLITFITVFKTGLTESILFTGYIILWEFAIIECWTQIKRKWTGHFMNLSLILLSNEISEVEFR